MSKRKSLSTINFYGKWDNKTPSVNRRKRFKPKNNLDRLRRSVQLIDSSIAMCKYYSENIIHNLDLKESKINGELALKRLYRHFEESQKLLKKIKQKKNYSESNRKSIAYLAKKINYYQSIIKI